MGMPVFEVNPGRPCRRRSPLPSSPESIYRYIIDISKLE